MEKTIDGDTNPTTNVDPIQCRLSFLRGAIAPVKSRQEARFKKK
jgi:hypothetical protein